MLSQSEKIKLKQIENKKIAEHIAVDYPETQRLSTNATIKYKKALDTYPDLKSLKNTKGKKKFSPSSQKIPESKAVQTAKKEKTIQLRHC